MLEKSLCLAVGLAVPSLAGVVAPVVAQPIPEATVSPWNLEIGEVYRFASKDLVPSGEKLDLWGLDATVGYQLGACHSVNLRVGYNYGNWDESITVANRLTEENEIEVYTFYLMPGYRYTDSIREGDAAWYIGANVGVSNMEVEWKMRQSQASESGGKNVWGFAASADLGLQYRLSESVYLYAAYQFFMNTCELKTVDETTNKQHYHSVTAGLGFQF